MISATTTGHLGQREWELGEGCHDALVDSFWRPLEHRPCCLPFPFRPVSLISLSGVPGLHFPALLGWWDGDTIPPDGRMEVQWELPSDPLLPVSTGFQRTKRLQGECGQAEDADAVHGLVLVTSDLCLTFFCLRASQGEKGKRGIDGVDGMKVILRRGCVGGGCAV